MPRGTDRHLVHRAHVLRQPAGPPGREGGSDRPGTGRTVWRLQAASRGPLWRILATPPESCPLAARLCDHPAATQRDPQAGRAVARAPRPARTVPAGLLVCARRDRRWAVFGWATATRPPPQDPLL